MVYHANSTTTFAEFLTEQTNEPLEKNQNFNRFGSKSYVMWQSSEFTNILLVIYDENNFPKEVLEFNGASTPFAWFSAANLKKSSLWNETKLSNAVQFKFDNQGFEITTRNDSDCEQEGFLEVTCDPETTCDQVCSTKDT